MEILLVRSVINLGRHGEDLNRFLRETNRGMDVTYEQGHEIMNDYQSAK